MNTSKHLRKPAMANNTGSKRVVLTAAAWAIVSSALAVHAAEPPYNPDQLGPDQFARVSGVCQTVIGLKPSEPLSSGYWLGNARLDYVTSHYRGCIVTLSDSLQSITDMQTARQADHNCRAKGLETGSPDLALCVLMNERPELNTTRSSGSAATGAMRAPAPGSFFQASPREINHREESACASLGLEPDNGTFEGCVKSLKDTFYSIDHPVN